jgi:ADP-heptose:LPS heptosyltransferase
MSFLKICSINVYGFLYKKLSEVVSLSYYFFVDTFFSIKKPLINSHKKILVFKHDAIGDMILWLSASKEIREYYKDWYIILVCCNLNKELAESFEYFDEIIGIEPRLFVRNLFYRISILKQISDISVDLAIYPHYSRYFAVGDALVRASSAREKIGFEGDKLLSSPLQKHISNRNYTKLLPSSRDRLMELERNAEFLKGIGISSAEPRVANLQKLLDLPASLTVEEPYFIIFPGASIAYRMWPFERFASVAKLIIKRFNWRVVICGGRSECEIANQVSDLIDLPNTLNFVGKTSLPELVEVIRHSQLVIGNETSAIHIAAAVNTPSVCLLGGGHFGRFMPYPETVKGIRPIPVFLPMDCYFCNWNCTLTQDRTQPYPCIENLSISAVMDAVDEALQAAPNLN